MDYEDHSHVRLPSVESTDDPVFTPQSSTTFSPKIPASLPDLKPDVPIPSIEPPTPGLFELPDTSNPRILASFSTYENFVDTFKEVNLSPANNGSQLFRFGQKKELSPFTFRSIHNTTPEPTARVVQVTTQNLISRSGSGPGPGSEHSRYVSSSRAELPSVDQTSVNVVTPQATKRRASSAPVQPPVCDRLPRPARYDTNDETPPEDEPYFNKDFQRALQAGKSIAQQIGSVLGICELARDRESQVFSMIQTANELSQFDAPSVCKIGIVGDSGVGKSSLINSLLDETDLARTAGLGAACTSVVTEYRLRKRGQSAKYTIEIDHMTDVEIEEQLRELIWSYRNFHLSDLDDKGFTADEQKRLEDQSKLAWDTLKAAFGSRRELTEEYLKDPSAGAEERIQQQLRLWTNGLQWPVDSLQSGWLGSADTVEECNRKTQQFLTGNLWPFIKVMRIFLRSQVLKSGAILTDLPGFHDSNNARIKAAEDYMYECDEIFVVADIARVGTNKNVEMILEKSLGRNLKSGRPSQGIALVCTKSEVPILMSAPMEESVLTALQDLDVDEVRKKFFADNRCENAAKVTLLERIVEEAEIDNEMEGALRRRDEAQEELDYLYMTARNDYIEKFVRSTHAKMLGTRPLSVFCVSNKIYKKNRLRANVHNLSMRGSGIPALRKHCHKIPAQAQFRIGHNFLTVNLKSLVQQVQLWLVGGSQETMSNDATVQRLLKTLQDDLKMVLGNYQGRSLATFLSNLNLPSLPEYLWGCASQTKFLCNLKSRNASEAIHAAGETQKGTSSDIMIQPMGNNLGNWTENALEVSYTWIEYHPSKQLKYLASFSATDMPEAQVGCFCRRYGSWGSPKVLFREWNQDLIDSMVDDMSSWWNLYADMSIANVADLENQILGLLDGLISQVKDFQGAPLFADSLTTMNDSVKYLFVKVKEVARIQINSIRRDASRNHQSSYIFEEMRPSYRACMEDSAKSRGDGVTARRLACLRQAIGSDRNPILFSAIRSRLQNDLFELAADTADILDSEIKNILTLIEHNIEMLRGTEAKVLAKNGNFLERLGRVAAGVLREMENIMDIAAQVMREAKEHGYY
ncbi:uncharacterized protein PAC_17491 [Phialocephala subalpina]|uniref:G domain-containing protein n=1 Tax=Phialocephala subalpina TaxID=576137 RepID=A0A1L7XRA5_9HELO|nr:uncharacterized protein PAC_17491 [Phialocephala subalpina]